MRIPGNEIADEEAKAALETTSKPQKNTHHTETKENKMVK
jgi:hypothetical protein